MLGALACAGGPAMLSPGAAGGPRGAHAGPVEDLASAEKAAVSRLEAVASWCDGQRLFGARDRVFERVLRLAPDHARARAVLKWTRDRAGAPWVRKAPYARPADWNKGLLPQVATRVADALAPLRAAGLAVADAEDLPLHRKEAALDLLADLLPEDAALHERRGDVRDGDRWVLPETAEARTVRARLRDVAEAAARSVDPSATRDRTSAWASAYRTAAIAVGSTDRADHAFGVLRAAVVARAVARAALGVPADRPADLKRLYTVTTREEAYDVVAKNTADPAASLAKAKLLGAIYLGPDAFLAYQDRPDVRRMACARAVVNEEVHARFSGGESGFVSEGLGQRLAFLALGEHGVPFVTVEGTDVPGADPDDEDPLPAEPGAWLLRAARLLERDGERRLAGVLTARLNAMTPGNVLVAYALAAYLLEGRAADLGGFVLQLQTAGDAAKAVEDGLAGDVGSLVRRVRRFCLENG